jgi:hypothetical protein
VVDRCWIAIPSFVTALVLAGCGDDSIPPGVDAGVPLVDSGTRPTPRMCRAGTGWSPGMPAFEDRTEAWGLAGLNALSFATGDLDGDGYADLIVSRGSIYDRVSGHVFMNRDGGTFDDRTAESRFYAVRDSTETGRNVSLVRLGDLDGDGDLDAFSGTFIYKDAASTREVLPDGAEILLNDGSGVFALTPSAVLRQQPDPLTSDGFFFDQNLDGRLDLALGYWWRQPPFTVPYGQQAQLFTGDGSGGFTDVTIEAGLFLPDSASAVRSRSQPRPLFGFQMCDLNDDGRMDIVGSAYGRFTNEVFLADGDVFHEIGATTEIGADTRIDYTDDENFRCFCVANRENAECAGVPLPRVVCPNRGWVPGQSDQLFSLGGNSYSHACGDFDNDGDFDLYETNIKHPDVGSSSDPSELIVNEGSSGQTLAFSRPGREAMGLTPPIDLDALDEGGQHGAAMDFDNDGRLDILLAGSPYPRNRGWIFHQRDTLSFEWIGAESGFHHACPLGTALADFDRDGDLDMIVGTYGCNDPRFSPDWTPPENQPVRFYENVSNENNWISIRLRGERSNRGGLGARVRLTAGGVTQTRLVTTSAQNAAFEPEAWFGLGASCDVERIEVRWPNADLSTDVYTNVLANYRVELREGTTDVTYVPSH